MTSSGQSDMTVTLHYAEWSRLLQLLDGARSAEGRALAGALRKQLLGQLEPIAPLEER